MDFRSLSVFEVVQHLRKTSCWKANRGPYYESYMAGYVLRTLRWNTSHPRFVAADVMLNSLMRHCEVVWDMCVQLVLTCSKIYLALVVAIVLVVHLVCAINDNVFRQPLFMPLGLKRVALVGGIIPPRLKLIQAVVGHLCGLLDAVLRILDRRLEHLRRLVDPGDERPGANPGSLKAPARHGATP